MGYSAYGGKAYRAGTARTIQAYTARSGKAYTAGTAVTRYKGNGGYVYGRGTSTTVYKQGNEYTSPLYVLDSNGKSRKVSLLRTSVYYAGSSATYYPGNGTSGYLRGDSESITPIGSEITGLYTRNSAGDTTVTPIGSEITGLYQLDSDKDRTVTPIGSEKVGVYVLDADKDWEYTEIGQKVSLKPAEFTYENITALTV